jgi:hypothetical protein
MPFFIVRTKPSGSGRRLPIADAVAFADRQAAQAAASTRYPEEPLAIIEAATTADALRQLEPGPLRRYRSLSGSR